MMGLNVKRTKMLAYVLGFSACAPSAASATAIDTTMSASVNQATALEMDAIASCGHRRHPADRRRG